MNVLERYIDRLMQAENQAKQKQETTKKKKIVVELNEFDNVFGKHDIKQTIKNMFDGIMIVR